MVKDDLDITLYLGLSVRMGTHWGKPVLEKDVVTQRLDYLGSMLIKVVRVSSVADGGQITLSTDFIIEFTAFLNISSWNLRAFACGICWSYYYRKFILDICPRECL